MNKTYLLNTRDSVIFNIFDKDKNSEILFEELKDIQDRLVEQLASNHIDYLKLKNCLIPANNGDMAFIFNWSMIDSPIYGEYILDLLLPYLLKDKFCYLHGDYANSIENSDIKKNKFEALNDALSSRKPAFIDPSFCYIVYLTNIGIKKAMLIHEFLEKKEDSYLGFCDLTNNNLFKTFLSTILVQAFIKLDHHIIQANPNIEFCQKSSDFCFLCLKNHIKKIRVTDVPSSYHDIFLLYKIPCLFELPYQDKDFYYQIKYLNTMVDSNFLKFFTIVISDKKIRYLFQKKRYIMDKWNIHNYDQASELLFSKIYYSITLGEIFNLEFKEEFDTYQFDICIEHLNINYIVGLKLLYKRKEIHFITLTSV